MTRWTSPLTFICALLAIMALIAHDLVARGHGPASYRAAQAIAGGYEGDGEGSDALPHAALKSLSTDPAARDDQLRADELDAGATWARLHNARSAADCPTSSNVFRSGCVAAMRGEWPSPNN